ncbi:hypothetical protein TPSD3_08600 [Thioflexithrix psekupsensis]|uniref:Lcl C-terminal domain-containing protein n=1 Tax=Thioflexithrix psekupsensis TaxID=1570016 RepID=A0A251X8P2_9GAMM|nr:hypothetical protein TPSD3_08600 [Thioflexithrix psekupsensis]
MSQLQNTPTPPPDATARFAHLNPSEGVHLLKLTQYGDMPVASVTANTFLDADRRLHLPRVHYDLGGSAPSDWWLTLRYHGTAEDGSLLLQVDNFGPARSGNMISGQVSVDLSGQSVKARSKNSAGGSPGITQATLSFYDVNGVELASFPNVTDENGNYSVTVPDGDVTYLKIRGGFFSNDPNRPFAGELMVLCLPTQTENTCHATVYGSLVMRLATRFADDDWTMRQSKARTLIAETLKIDRDPTLEVIDNFETLFDGDEFWRKIGNDAGQFDAWADVLTADLADGFLDDASISAGVFKQAQVRVSAVANYAIQYEQIQPRQVVDEQGNVSESSRQLVLESLSGEKTAQGTQIETQQFLSDVILKEELENGESTIVYQSFQVGDWQSQLNAETTVLAKVFSRDPTLFNLPVTEKNRIARLLVTAESELMQQAQDEWLEAVNEDILAVLYFDGLDELIAQARTYVAVVALPEPTARRMPYQAPSDPQRTARSAPASQNMGWVGVEFDGNSTVSVGNSLPIALSVVGKSYSFSDFMAGVSGTQAFTKPILEPNLVGEMSGGAVGTAAAIAFNAYQKTDFQGTTFDNSLFLSGDQLAHNFPDQNKYCTEGEGRYVVTKELGWNVHTINNVMLALQALTTGVQYKNGHMVKIKDSLTAIHTKLENAGEIGSQIMDGIEAILLAADLVLDIYSGIVTAESEVKDTDSEAEDADSEAKSFNAEDAHKLRIDVIDPTRNALGNLKRLVEVAVAALPQRPNRAEIDAQSIFNMLIDKKGKQDDAMYRGLSKDVGLAKLVAAQLLGHHLAKMTPTHVQQGSQKVPCQVGALSCKTVARIYVGYKLGIFAKGSYEYTLIDKLNPHDMKGIFRSIGKDNYTRQTNILFHGILSNLEKRAKEIVGATALLGVAAAVKSPEDIASVIQAVGTVVLTELFNWSRETVADNVENLLRIVLSSNAFGAAQKANALVGILGAQFATPNEYPFDIKVVDGELTFSPPSVQHKMFTYGIQPKLNMETFGLENEDCHGLILTGDCFNNGFFLLRDTNPETLSKNILMVANSERQARTRNSALFYFNQSKASTEVALRVNKSLPLLGWSFDIQERPYSEGSYQEWVSFRPEVNQVRNALITAGQVIDHLKEDPATGLAFFDFFDVLVTEQSGYFSFIMGRNEASVLVNHKSRGVFREVFQFFFLDDQLKQCSTEESSKKTHYPAQHISYYKMASAQDIMKNAVENSPNSPSVHFHKFNQGDKAFHCITNLTDIPLRLVRYNSGALKFLASTDLSPGVQYCLDSRLAERYRYAVFDAIFSQYTLDYKWRDDADLIRHLALRTDNGSNSFTYYEYLSHPWKIDYNAHNSAFIVDRLASEFSDIGPDIVLPEIETRLTASGEASSFPKVFPVEVTFAGRPINDFHINIVESPKHGELSVDGNNLIYSLTDTNYVGTDFFSISVISGIRPGSEVKEGWVDVIGTAPPPPPFTGTSKLNDTGITWGGNYPSGNNATCTGATVEMQDCSHGRDVTHNDPSDGHAGFSFTKISATGQALSAAATEWSCVQDNVTGLMWEVKQGGNGKVGDEGLHDADDRYNWYNTDPDTNGGADGYADDDGAICYGYQKDNPDTYCNTQAYVARVNVAGYCGYKDWRMPNREELRSIVHYGRRGPVIDADYFPNTRSSWYWSSSPVVGYPYSAWYVPFHYDGDGHGGRNNYNHVRLVRGGQ